MKDQYGSEIGAGDLIVYAAKSGERVSLRQARVLAIVPKQASRWTISGRERLKVQVLTRDNTVGRIVYLSKPRNIMLQRNIALISR